MGRTTTRWAGTVVGALVAVAALAACEPGQGCADGDSTGRPLEVVALTTDQRLLCFEDDKADEARFVGQVLGFELDNFMVGVDYRPATGDLYGLGNNGGIYTIDDQTAEATFRARMNVALSGNEFGIDFNPVVDRLRVISDSGQNLRVNVDTGATSTDTSLAYPANPPSQPNPTPGTGITGAAYTNNDSNTSTGTTLYDIDANLDQVVIQSPANSGLLAPTGKLGVNADPANLGFDIYSSTSGGRVTGLRAFASLQVGGVSRFYQVTLSDGAVRSLGTFGGQDVADIAVPLTQN